MGAVESLQLTLDFNAPLPEHLSENTIKLFPSVTSQPETKKKVEEQPVFKPKVSGDVSDYSEYPANRIYIADEKSVLSKERPEYVPPLDFTYVKSNYYIPPVYKAKELYIISSGVESPKYYKLSLDVFAATVDYYIKYGKALTKKETAEKIEKLKEKAKNYFDSKDFIRSPNDPNYKFFSSILEGKHTIKAKPIRFLSTKYITYDQKWFLEEHFVARHELWRAWQEIRGDLEQKLIDMSCQIGDLESTYTKGAKTSYGNSNTNDALKEDLGILVKRQNGDAITKDEINEIKEAFSIITPIFGNLKKVCTEYGLKVSHSGLKNMHARTAMGIFYDYFKAIGVQFGNVEMNHVILAHELSHFLDSWTGKENRHFFASDSPGSLENQIAKTFRNEMNKKKTATIESKYLNRTCECFARAMEQYTACMVSPSLYFAYTAREAYVEDTKFKDKIIPLIDKLILERWQKWHGNDYCIENSSGTIDALIKQANEQFSGYDTSNDFKSYDDEDFDKFVNHTRFQIQWHLNKIKEYQHLKELPGNVSEILGEYAKAVKRNSEIRHELIERLHNENPVLFPISPLDNTAETFTSNLLGFVKIVEDSKNPLETAKKLAKEIFQDNSTNSNDFLSKLGSSEALRSLVESMKLELKTGKRDESHYDRDL